MYLLDTNVISELRKAGDNRADANVIAWLSNVEASSLYISAVSILELEIGVLRIERRDATQGARLRRWMNTHVMPEFSSRILPIEAVVAMQCARLHVPNPRPEGDALIAATALVHGMTVVTRNVADFEPLGVSLLNPWDAAVNE